MCKIHSYAVLLPVMLRPQGQTDLEAKSLALALTTWPRPREFGLGLASVSLTWPRKMCYPMQNNISCIHFVYHCNIHYKDVVEHFIGGHKLVYVFLTLSPCVLIQKYLHVAGLDLASASKTWTWPRGSGLDLDLRVLASALTPLTVTVWHYRCIVSW